MDAQLIWPGVAASLLDKVLVFKMETDCQPVVLLRAAGKGISCLSDVSCDAAQTSGLTELSLEGHDMEGQVKDPIFASTVSLVLTLWPLLKFFFVFQFYFARRKMEVWHHFGTRWRTRPCSPVSSRSHCLWRARQNCEHPCLEQHSWLQLGKLWMLRPWQNWAWTNCPFLRIVKRYGRLFALMGLIECVGLQVVCCYYKMWVRLAGEVGAHHGTMRQTKVLAYWKSTHQSWCCDQACLTATGKSGYFGLKLNSIPRFREIHSVETSKQVYPNAV